MSCAGDSANAGFVSVPLYISCSLSNRLFSIVHTMVSSSLCKEVYASLVECSVSS